MKTLTIKRLVIVSEKTKTANQFEFNQGKNLITSDKNTVGKSTLVKMIMWAFGCKPKFDATWKAMEARTAITFAIDRSEYTIIRDGSQIQIRKGREKFESYTKISGAYSEKIANLLMFKPNFKIKSSDNYSVATPDGYFMAYYLDQECWTKAWSSLEGLMHFDKAIPDLVKTHSGLLTSDYFECQIEELNALEKKKEIESIKEQYHNALDIVSKECSISPSIVTIDSDLLVLQNTEITKTLAHLQEQQTELWNKLTKLYTRKNHLQTQVLLEEANIASLAEDYNFANALNHIIHCPVCNSVVKNDVVEKSGLIADRVSCERILEAHKNEIEKINDELEELQSLYDDVHRNVDSINKKYIVETTESRYTGAEVISYIAEKTIHDKLIVATSKQQNEIEQKDLEIKLLKKSQSEIKKRVNKDAINSFFCQNLQECQKALGLDYSSIQEKVKSPTDYNKVLQGGAADKTRSILSYYAALYLLISHMNNEVVGPLIIDTPFQQEQSDDNETRIMTLIEDKLVNKRSCNQIFLCAKKDEGIERYKQNAKVIELNETRALLSAARYSDCADMYAQLSK